MLLRAPQIPIDRVHSSQPSQIRCAGVRCGEETTDPRFLRVRPQPGGRPTSRKFAATIRSATRWSSSRRSAIEDSARNVCVGYKDLGPDEFWVRGHMPGMPLMPGVIMCEAAAQLASYYSHKYKLMARDHRLRRAGRGPLPRRGAARRPLRHRLPPAEAPPLDHDLRVPVLRQPEPGLRRHPQGRLAPQRPQRSSGGGRGLGTRAPTRVKVPVGTSRHFCLLSRRP